MTPSVSVGWQGMCAGGGGPETGSTGAPAVPSVMDCDAAAAAVAANLTSDLSESMAVSFRDGSRYWVQRVMQPAVVLVGVLGNIITIVVLTRRRMSSSTNTYLTALAVTDLAYLVCVYTLSYENHPGITDSRYIWYWRHWKYAIWIVDCTS